MRTAYIKNGLFIVLMTACVVFLYAQTTQGKFIGGSTGNVSENEGVTDTSRLVDNTEGFLELDRIVERYGKGGLIMSGDVLFYNSMDSMTRPDERVGFKTISTPIAFSYELDSVLTVQSDTLLLQIDKREKTIAVIEQGNSESPIQQKSYGVSQLKEMKSYIRSAEVRTEGIDKVLAIQFTEESPSNVLLYEVFYNPATYQIKRVRMHVSDGEVSDASEEQLEESELVAIDENNNEIQTGYYADVRINVYEWIYKVEKKAEPELLKTSAFVKKERGEYAAGTDFKNYQILN